MARQTRESLLKQIFTDYKHYPYGFSRAGDYSIKEAQALSKYGTLIGALLDGVVEPSNKEDANLLAVALGEREPSTPAEKAWVKYQRIIGKPKPASIYGSKPSSMDDYSVDSTELEAEFDD
ncbi:DUF413 domain-containing protein [Neptunicella marina]|uniref:Macrodomain Ori protein n=1 Tax=Neptunicella marina TaxID=2125989 RepID=A0A8J6IUP5_9ALTE|nr:DUF413 domain-containing protein [Neptunicella marina]MBC3767041.1 DUF413 domain-containing protein [Neptunicella marina]